MPVWCLTAFLDQWGATVPKSELKWMHMFPNVTIVDAFHFAPDLARQLWPVRQFRHVAHVWFRPTSRFQNECIHETKKKDHKAIRFLVVTVFDPSWNPKLESGQNMSERVTRRTCAIKPGRVIRVDTNWIPSLKTIRIPMMPQNSLHLECQTVLEDDFPLPRSMSSPSIETGP